jgi:uncharacterized protein involved in exopolysaccharide biosynthesis
VKVYSPLSSLENALDQWWLIALLTVWGGLIGWVYHTTRPPLYEAQAVFYISIDYTRTGQLTQFEQDQALWGAVEVIRSDPVVRQVVTRARSEGLAIEVRDLRLRSHFERKQSRWFLRIRDPDPRTAATLTNLWAEAGFAALTEAHLAALQAQSLHQYRSSLATCLQLATEIQDPNNPCKALAIPAIQAALEQANADLSEQLLASRGVLPAIVLDLPETATIPREPVQFGRNSLVMIGGLIGFIVGVVSTQFQLPARLKRGLRRG